MAKRITRDEREDLLLLFTLGCHALAEARALQLGLATNYPWKLALARGLVPRISKRWAGHMRECAACVERAA